MPSRSIRNLVAMAMMLSGNFWPASTLARVFQYTAMTYLTLDLVITARTGYLRRRPHWTRDSWQRYSRACAIPVVAFLMFVLMMTALEFHLPIAGASRSPMRSIWILGMMAFMLTGVFGLLAAVHWLTDGEPSQQFTWPRRKATRPR